MAPGKGEIAPVFRQLMSLTIDIGIQFLIKFYVHIRKRDLSFKGKRPLVLKENVH